MEKPRGEPEHVRLCPSLVPLDVVRGLGWEGELLPWSLLLSGVSIFQWNLRQTLLKLPASCLSSLAGSFLDVWDPPLPCGELEAHGLHCLLTPPFTG